MKIKYCLAFLMLAVLAIVLMGAATTLSTRVSSGTGLSLGVKQLEFPDIEEDLFFDPTYGADNGFVVNPYQAGNPDRNQALIIKASVSYILKEVKAFIMFAVALAVLALIAYLTIAYIILNRIVKTVVNTEESQKHIEDRNHNTAFLSRSIDEMLSEIDTVMENCKVKLSVLQ